MAPSKKPALFIVDMQNATCHDEGTFGKSGLPIQNHRDIVPTIQKLRDAAHAAHVPVFFTVLNYKEDYSDSGVMFEDLPAMMESKAFIRGSWDAAVIDELKPDTGKGEVVVGKTRHTPFYDTDLEQQLRDRGVNQLILTGVGTNVCVEGSQRDAFTRGYSAKTVSDATATLSAEERDASLASMRWFGGTLTSEEALEALAKAGST